MPAQPSLPNTHTHTHTHMSTHISQPTTKFRAKFSVHEDSVWAPPPTSTPWPLNTEGPSWSSGAP